jgi:hypothetical protein
MNVADTKKALLTASRAYTRAMRAGACGPANNNLRLGQKWEQRGRDGVRALIPAKLEWRHYSPVQRELVELQQALPNAEYNAHLHRLGLCKVSQMDYERHAAEDRARSAHGADKSRERRERKRPKKGT